MNCANCQQENQEGSRFCKACGAELMQAEEVILEQDLAPVAEEVDFVEESIPVMPVTPQKAGKKHILPVVLASVMIVLLLASAVGNVFQYLQYKMLRQEKESFAATLKESTTTLMKENAELNRVIEYLQETITEMTVAMNEEAVTLDAFGRLTDSLVKGKWGYYSDEFYTDRDVLYLTPGETINVTLYTKWQGDGTVSAGTDSNYASVEFQEDSWETQTSVKITGVKEGMTVITFAWDREKTFDIVVFVEE